MLKFDSLIGEAHSKHHSQFLYTKDAENQIKTKTDRIIPVDIQVHALGF